MRPADHPETSRLSDTARTGKPQAYGHDRDLAFMERRAVDLDSDHALPARGEQPQTQHPEYNYRCLPQDGVNPDIGKKP